MRSTSRSSAAGKVPPCAHPARDRGRRGHHRDRRRGLERAGGRPDGAAARRQPQVRRDHGARRCRAARPRRSSRPTTAARFNSPNDMVDPQRRDDLLHRSRLPGAATRGRRARTASTACRPGRRPPRWSMRGASSRTASRCRSTKPSCTSAAATAVAVSGQHRRHRRHGHADRPERRQQRRAWGSTAQGNIYATTNNTVAVVSRAPGPRSARSRSAASRASPTSRSGAPTTSTLYITALGSGSQNGLFRVTMPLPGMPY